MSRGEAWVERLCCERQMEMILCEANCSRYVLPSGRSFASTYPLHTGQSGVTRESTEKLP